jgi:RNA polymerase sigma-70 factor (ECF subfamily)
MRGDTTSALPTTVQGPMAFDLEAFRAGDPQVFRALLDSLSVELQRFLLSLGVSCEDAGDIIASVSAKLYRGRGRMESYQHIRRSTFFMARNEAIDCLRLRSRWWQTAQAVRYLHNPIANVPNMDLAPEVEECRERLLQKVWCEIRQLPAQRQKVLHLYYTENLSTGEIAKRLNLRPQTVLNHKTRALSTVKKAVGRMAPPL